MFFSLEVRRGPRGQSAGYADNNAHDRPRNAANQLAGPPGHKPAHGNFRPRIRGQAPMTTVEWRDSGRKAVRISLAVSTVFRGFRSRRSRGRRRQPRRANSEDSGGADSNAPRSGHSGRSRAPFRVPDPCPLASSAYRVSDSRASNNWFVVVTTWALPRYAVEARIRFTRLVPMSVFDSSRLPETTVPMPCVPGVP